MPRRPGGIGAGSMAMGGPGKKPAVPVTPMGGNPPMPGSMGIMPRRSGGAGAPPMGASTMGPRAASGAGVRAFKKGGEAHKKYEKGGAVHADEAQDRALFKKMEKEEGAKEKVVKHAHGGPVIAGHTTHGMPGTEHPREQGISKGSDGRRGGVKGAGLDPISSQNSNAKGRVGHHTKAG
jgi:hypothetical protein